MSNNKGIPTIGVRGIQFRSRIEAQWAYIFEKLEWNWEYEPIDLEGYIPDFIIKFDDDEILIEIKGDTNIWKNYEEHKNKIIKSGWIKPFAILGSIYKISENWSANCPIIGIVCHLDNVWYDDDLIIRKERERKMQKKDGFLEVIQGGMIYAVEIGKIQQKQKQILKNYGQKQKIRFSGKENKIKVILHQIRNMK